MLAETGEEFATENGPLVTDVFLALWRLYGALCITIQHVGDSAKRYNNINCGGSSEEDIDGVGT
jgi:hypothetical protein